jgi:hypothetical protein
MRIDEENYDLFENNDSITNFDAIENDMTEIDNLIAEINDTSNELRQRKNTTVRKHPKELSFNYYTSSNLDDIDDVIIDIPIPKEYYLNQERQIVEYDFMPQIIHMCMGIIVAVVNVIRYTLF